MFWLRAISRQARRLLRKRWYKKRFGAILATLMLSDCKNKYSPFRFAETQSRRESVVAKRNKNRPFRFAETQSRRESVVAKRNKNRPFRFAETQSRRESVVAKRNKNRPFISKVR